MLLNQTKTREQRTDTVPFLTSRRKKKLARDREIILNDLRRAVTLGNMHNHQVDIHFEDNGGELQIEEGIVTAATERFVLLRGGKSIPIDSISRVIT